MVWGVVLEKEELFLAILKQKILNASHIVLYVLNPQTVGNSFQSTYYQNSQYFFNYHSRHTKTHCGEKPYKYSKCGFAFCETIFKIQAGLGPANKKLMALHTLTGTPRDLGLLSLYSLRNFT